MQNLKIIATLGYLSCNADKEILVKKIPELTEDITELVVLIKNTKNLDEANGLFDLLLIATWPIATLICKHHVVLQNKLRDLINYEHIDDRNFRKIVYEDIKKGKILTEFFGS